MERSVLEEALQVQRKNVNRSELCRLGPLIILPKELQFKLTNKSNLKYQQQRQTQQNIKQQLIKGAGEMDKSIYKTRASQLVILETPRSLVQIKSKSNHHSFSSSSCSSSLSFSSNQSNNSTANSNYYIPIWRTGIAAFLKLKDLLASCQVCHSWSRQLHAYPNAWVHTEFKWKSHSTWINLKRVELKRLMYLLPFIGSLNLDYISEESKQIINKFYLNNLQQKKDFKNEKKEGNQKLYYTTLLDLNILPDSWKGCLTKINISGMGYDIPAHLQHNYWTNTLCELSKRFSLTELNFSCTHIQDKHIVELNRFSNTLRKLKLNYTNITELGICKLNKLNLIEELEILLFQVKNTAILLEHLGLFFYQLKKLSLVIIPPETLVIYDDNNNNKYIREQETDHNIEQEEYEQYEQEKKYDQKHENYSNSTKKTYLEQWCIQCWNQIAGLTQLYELRVIFPSDILVPMSLQRIFPSHLQVLHVSARNWPYPAITQHFLNTIGLTRIIELNLTGCNNPSPTESVWPLFRYQNSISTSNNNNKNNNIIRNSLSLFSKLKKIHFIDCDFNAADWHWLLWIHLPQNRWSSFMLTNTPMHTQHFETAEHFGQALSAAHNPLQHLSLSRFPGLAPSSKFDQWKSLLRQSSLWTNLTSLDLSGNQSTLYRTANHFINTWPSLLFTSFKNGCCLRYLNLSFYEIISYKLPLKEIVDHCFRPLSNLRELVLLGWKVSEIQDWNYLINTLCLLETLEIDSDLDIKLSHKGLTIIYS